MARESYCAGLIASKSWNLLIVQLHRLLQLGCLKISMFQQLQAFRVLRIAQLILQMLLRQYMLLLEALLGIIFNRILLHRSRYKVLLRSASTTLQNASTTVTSRMVWPLLDHFQGETK